MNDVSILQPLVVYLLLALVVAVRMGLLRIRDLRERRVHPQTFEIRSGRASLSAAAERTADHYQNLFEMPVVFVTACLVIYVTGLADIFHVSAAWLYIALRLLHSVIHLTYNRVYHRFLAFIASFVPLAVIVLRLAYQLFT